MNNMQYAILQLIKKALNSSSKLDEWRFSTIEWRKFLEIVKEQEVAGICIDTIKYLPNQNRPDRSVIMKWIGYVTFLEKNNYMQQEAAISLSYFLHKKGIRMLVLKGISISRLYPNPIRRYSCDMDVFLMHKGNKDCCCNIGSAWNDGNRALQEIGIYVNREYYRNSSFNYKGLHVENHRYCTYVKGSIKKKKYEVLLRHLLANPTYFTTGYIEIPCDMFVALHMLSHAYGHFLSEGITLRYLCDWAVILKSFKDSLDWEQFILYTKEYGIDKFMYSMSRLVHDYLDIALPFVCDRNIDIDNMLLKDIFNISNNRVLSNGKITRRFAYAMHKLRSSWKYRYFSDKPMIVALMEQSYGYLFEKENSIDAKLRRLYQSSGFTQ